MAGRILWRGSEQSGSEDRIISGNSVMLFVSMIDIHGAVFFNYVRNIHYEHSILKI